VGAAAVRARREAAAAVKRVEKCILIWSDGWKLKIVLEDYQKGVERVVKEI